jgi:hypothetical protein
MVFIIVMNDSLQNLLWLDDPAGIKFGFPGHGRGAILHSSSRADTVVTMNILLC